MHPLYPPATPGVMGELLLHRRRGLQRSRSRPSQRPMRACATASTVVGPGDTALPSVASGTQESDTFPRIEQRLCRARASSRCIAGARTSSTSPSRKCRSWCSARSAAASRLRHNAEPAPCRRYGCPALAILKKCISLSVSAAGADARLSRAVAGVLTALFGLPEIRMWVVSAVREQEAGSASRQSRLRAGAW